MAASRLAISEDIHCRCVATQLGTIICQPICNGTSSAVQSIKVMRWRRCVGAEPCRGWQFLMTFIAAVWPPQLGPVIDEQYQALCAAKRCRDPAASLPAGAGAKRLRTFIFAVCLPSCGTSSAIRSKLPVPLRYKAMLFFSGAAPQERSGHHLLSHPQ